MAEAVQVPSRARYFCYQCDREVSLPPSAQITCPDCLEGFLEEVPDGQDHTDSFEDDSDVDESEINLLNLLSIENLFRRTVMNIRGADADSEESQRHTSGESNDEPDAPDWNPVVEVFSARNMLEELEENFLGHGAGIRRVGDYFFGDDMDALSTLLLNETEIVGPPPLPKEQIKLLPVITVSKEDVDKAVQCTICMEDFAVREKAKALPCQHYYHEKCITPWLERHATCPNCRKTVEIQPKNRRSQSCPRTDYNLGSSTRRRASESTSVSGFFTSSMNPFRFL